MSKPLVVVIPHQLGREAARQRLQAGIEMLRQRFGDKIASIDGTWAGDRFDFAVTAMGQGVSGGLEVRDADVLVEVKLPWLLAMIAEKARGFIQKEGQVLLEKRK